MSAQGVPSFLQCGLVEMRVRPFLGDIISQLLNGIRVPSKRKLLRAFNPEDSASDNRREGRVGGRVALSRGLGVEVSGADIETDFEMRRFSRRVYIDKPAVWP